jgi:septum formation protein
MPELILASTSPYRRQLLERLGVPFTAMAPCCDEDALKAAHGSDSPLELAEYLALAKADSLRAQYPGAAIIGSDQLASIGGDILGKPGTADAAVAQLQRLSGQTHELITAMVVLHAGDILRHTDVTRLTMRPLTRAQLERYVAADRPLDCAGAYKLEKLGIALFTSIESDDHSAIVGLPLLALTRMLSGIGYEIP